MVIVVAGLHNLAAHLGFYYSFIYFDDIMHFLGGLLVGLVALRLLFVSEMAGFSHFNNTVAFLVTIGAVLIVGLFWELFEVFIGATQINAIDLRDTISDLVLDTIGAIAAFWYYYKKVWRRTLN